MSDHTTTTQTTTQQPKPKTLLDIKIGKRLRNDKRYITDEQLTVTNHQGINKIPQPVKRFLTQPTVERKSGDIVTFKSPAGNHIKAEKLAELLEKEEKVNLVFHETRDGRFNTEHIRVEVTA